MSVRIATNIYKCFSIKYQHLKVLSNNVYRYVCMYACTQVLPLLIETPINLPQRKNQKKKTIQIISTLKASRQFCLSILNVCFYDECYDEISIHPATGRLTQVLVLKAKSLPTKQILQNGMEYIHICIYIYTIMYICKNLK